METETTMLKEYHDERGAAVMFAIFAALRALTLACGILVLVAAIIKGISLLI